VKKVERLEDLIELAARDRTGRRFDGHLTILKFTTNWRVGYGTPSDDGHLWDSIELMAEGKTLREALNAFITKEDQIAKTLEELPEKLGHKIAEGLLGDKTKES